MNKHLKTQIERIIEEGSGTTRSVIVQMKFDDSGMKDLLRTTSKTMRDRLLLTSAREVLPPAAVTMKTTKTGKRTAARLKQLRSHVFSLAAQVGTIKMAPTSKAALRKMGNESLAELNKSLFVRKSHAAVVEQKQKTKSKSSKNISNRRFPCFWSSSSAALELHKDALWTMPKEVQGIASIYANKSVRIPPVVDAPPSSLPRSITDTKVSSWGLNAINALAAWGAFNARGAGVKVCVLDTGVDASHPELVGKLAPADWAEFDLAGNQVIGSIAHDSDQHGTHCSGTVLGGNSGGRWIGVAPEATLAHGLVLKNGRGSTAQILAGMQWAIDLGVDVISMSLGGLQMDPEVFDTYTLQILTANQLGIPVVVAIGNEGSQTAGSPGNDYFSFAVGATDSQDRAAGFSGGRTSIITQSRYIDAKYLPLPYSKPDVTAPGVAIHSCIPGRKYATWNGTSMATPHVVGAIACLLSATNIKGAVPQNELAYILQDLIVGSVEEIGESGKDHRFGFGRIDVLRAIDFAKERGY